MLILLASNFTPVPVQAAKPGSQSVGNDISYPQCGTTLPAKQAFGIVGVNGRAATKTNQCRGEQLEWAYRSVGGTSQPKARLYVNTANPQAR